MGGIMPVALNGGNEAAVAAFLKGRIPFGAIARVNMHVLEETAIRPVTCVEDVYEADRAARVVAESVITALEV